jgi:uncharacterized membrane protein YphA (DoxX/SURF4 family)
MSPVKSAILRIQMLPFEITIAFLFIMSGIAQIFKWGPPDNTLLALPFWEARTITILEIVTGLFIVFGVASSQRRFELAGQFFLVAILITRLLLYANAFGIDEDFIISGVFYATLLWAAVSRTVALLRGDSLAWVRGNNDFRL